MSLTWKPDWENAKAAYLNWWKGEGMVLSLTATDPAPRPGLPEPQRPADITAAWLDPAYRCAQDEYTLSRTHFLAEAFPYFDTQIGPGSLSTFLGARPEFAERNTL